jgi:hypothetical protein
MQANDSILVTPGSGATVATHLINGKEYQVMMPADPDGHLIGSRQDWWTYFTPATNAAARRIGDLFNSDASAILRVRGVWIIPTTTAITGAQQIYDFIRTSSVGTGGTAMTPRPFDTTYTALPAGVTARAGATGGAAAVYTYMQAFHFNEETNASTQIAQYQNQLPQMGDRFGEIVLRQNQGFMVQQNAGSVGLTGALIYFTVDV